MPSPFVSLSSSFSSPPSTFEAPAAAAEDEAFFFPLNSAHSVARRAFSCESFASRSARRFSATAARWILLASNVGTARGLGTAMTCVNTCSIRLAIRCFGFFKQWLWFANRTHCLSHSLSASTASARVLATSGSLSRSTGSYLRSVAACPGSGSFKAASKHRWSLYCISVGSSFKGNADNAGPAAAEEEGGGGSLPQADAAASPFPLRSRWAGSDSTSSAHAAKSAPSWRTMARVASGTTAPNPALLCGFFSPSFFPSFAAANLFPPPPPASVSVSVSMASVSMAWARRTVASLNELNAISHTRRPFSSGTTNCRSLATNRTSCACRAR
mmetsp:Transcript_38010/g.76809  ORF Transcript_38010/g.76809 Transcript_38010/m.76809 type:complete len:329 (+) Transcript_38010:3262-4248(+)